MALGHLQWDQEELFGEKTEYKKSRETVPLRESLIIFFTPVVLINLELLIIVTYIYKFETSSPICVSPGVVSPPWQSFKTPTCQDFPWCIHRGVVNTHELGSCNYTYTGNKRIGIHRGVKVFLGYIHILFLRFLTNLKTPVDAFKCFHTKQCGQQKLLSKKILRWQILGKSPFDV